MRIIILITLIIIVLSSENTGLRIDLNVEIPLLENQYVIFNATQQQEGASSQILPTYKLLANLKNNSLGIYSQMFDFLQYTNQSQINCYQQNVVVLTDVFSCTQSCNSTPDTSNLGIRNISYVLTDEKDEQLQYLVIDNSQLPCVNGTFFKLIVPWITVQALFKFQDSSYLIGTIIIVLLVTIITIQIMSIQSIILQIKEIQEKNKKIVRKKYY
ncbi:unnamed protein product [Paramecium primaurelia]|uniref:Transmembrane protein n=1 Tax=Paramecium primaurelia TaxID=5886 RepID=A0A8S1KG56_PARPR|nr:unnamed protein product [Paramecium primaurelia]